MPIADVRWTVKTNEEQKRAFMETLAATVSEHFKVPSQAINVIITEVPCENVRFPEAVITFTYSVTPDRNAAAKKEIIEKLTAYILRLDPTLEPSKVVLFFHGLQGESVGVGGVPR